MNEFQLVSIIALILSIVIHEVAHGYAADMQGDPTARLAGRLTLNPISHIDPVGSILLPGLLVLTNAPIFFGWAKPVPYNPYNLRNQKWGEAIVAAAGPGTNFFIAFVFAGLIRIDAGSLLGINMFNQLAYIIVLMNVLLALFNLIPIPPLDGSKIIKAFLPIKFAMSYNRFEASIMQMGFFVPLLIIMAIMFVFGGVFASVVFGFVDLLTGPVSLRF